MRTETGYNIIRLPNYINVETNPDKDYNLKQLIQHIGRYYDYAYSNPEKAFYCNRDFNNMRDFICNNWCTVFVCFEKSVKNFGKYTFDDIESNKSQLAALTDDIMFKHILLNKNTITFLCISYDYNDIRYYNSSYELLDMKNEKIGELLGIDLYSLELNHLYDFISNRFIDGFKLNDKMSNELKMIAAFYANELVTIKGEDYSIISIGEDNAYHNIYDNKAKRCILQTWYYDIQRYGKTKYFLCEDVYYDYKFKRYVEIHLFNVETMQMEEVEEKYRKNFDTMKLKIKILLSS